MPDQHDLGQIRQASVAKHVSVFIDGKPLCMLPAATQSMCSHGKLLCILPGMASDLALETLTTSKTQS